ncbi:hypothetical protein [Streptomyces rapamycinicus]|uniref:Uncharacterized protein n=2 Tax=Streptomyces rapamycinicus TaxID=1226757 RepID=A0A0A0NK90_STRRN|nr:hypothetical protein [Streptomyces rapamycinicus]AGP54810.1 hypothetical protein M271_16215 [Streptomyces rapamycinicus NRRL 5491]MBB4782332.1 hypothetical protein [Streptomyces rapamycinicus]RLV82184.1 hypothetical protein D3C57_127405 [Streptomyces rapamycinicus NRRL 5491]UTO62854.1 hypothetical protein LJB45_11345 [Streptomyces rapamycinicus]UTP30812.1 hypothetical protein LIV37_16460 [Streptomyces rapamycinicus NRRL 5491]
MLHHELHRIREAELLREAAVRRLVREAAEGPGGRSAGRDSGGRLGPVRRWRGDRSPRSYRTAA